MQDQFPQLPHRMPNGILTDMAKKRTTGKSTATGGTSRTTKKRAAKKPATISGGKPSSLLDGRDIYCGDCLEKLADLPDNCVDLIYIDPPFNSNRNYEVFWGETKEKRAHSGGEDRHASTQAYIDYMRPRVLLPLRLARWTSS